MSASDDAHDRLTLGDNMDFEYSAKTKALQARVGAFMDEHVYPNEAACTAELVANTVAGKRWTPLQTIV